MTRAKAKPRKRDPISQGVRFDVFRRDNFTCVYCGRSSPEVTLHCDHVEAHSKGGSDDKSNLVTACIDCNLGKSTKSVNKIHANAARLPANVGGLVGLFGHRIDDGGHIHNQFSVIGMADGETCIIQLYSFLDGSATVVEMVDVSEIRGNGYRLYATERAFKMAYWEEKERRGLLRNKTAEEAYEMSEWVEARLRGKAA
ncbi:HNH endonuclease [Rhizobium leucaenae]|nr:HNH endonuclease [Rhizobium leucaenae]